MRRTFADELYKHMKKDDRIWLITGDLGYKMFDKIRDDFSNRFINAGAAEAAMMDIAVGLSLEGKIPFVYSITTFLLYRPFETIRTYINHESLNVKLIGSGRDKDYAHDGYSHWSEDAWKFFKRSEFFENEPILNNITPYWPETKEEIPSIVNAMIEEKKPSFLSLRR